VSGTELEESLARPEPATDDLWSALADPQTAPGGGSAAAIAARLATALVAKAARRSADSWPDAPGVAAQATSLADRCAELAEADARAFGAALKALEERRGIEARLEESVTALLAITEAAADVGELAALTAEKCDGTFRGDAVTGALLAEAGACAAAILVAGNLGVTRDDDRLQQARQLAAQATAAVRRALEAGP
jgi:formiminotetrahydrofolate cyclodeaminase